MKKTNLRIALLAVAYLSFTALFSQVTSFTDGLSGTKRLYSTKGEYMLLESGEVLEGFIQYNKNLNELYFRKSSRVKWEIVKQEVFKEIIQFQDERQVYIREDWNGKRLFLPLVVAGPIVMYEMEDFFLLKEEEVFITLTKETYREELTSIFETKCSWSYNEQLLSYSKEFIAHLIHGYNRYQCFKVQRKNTGLEISRALVNYTLTLPIFGQPKVSVSSQNFNFRLRREIPTYKNANTILSLTYFTIQDSNKEIFGGSGSLSTDFSYLILESNLRYNIDKFFIEGGLGLGAAFNSSFFARTSGEDFQVNNGLVFGGNAVIGYTFLNRNNWKASVHLRGAAFFGPRTTLGLNSFGIYVSPFL